VIITNIIIITLSLLSNIGTYQVIKRFEKNILLALPTFILTTYALLLIFVPQIWLFQPVNIISSNFQFGGDFTLDANSAASFMLALGSMTGIMLIGITIRYWRIRFVINLLVYGLLYFVFFYGLTSKGATILGSDNEDQLFLFKIGVIALLISIPASMIFSWKEVCVREQLILGVVLSVASKGFIIISGSFILFFIFMSFVGILFSGFDGFSEVIVIASGLVMLRALKESFTNLLFDFAET